MKVTQTITVEIKGQTFELTPTEAKQLRDSLNTIVAAAPPPSVFYPQKSLSDFAREYEQQRPPATPMNPHTWPQPFVVGDPAPNLPWTTITCTGGRQQ